MNRHTIRLCWRFGWVFAFAFEDVLSAFAAEKAASHSPDIYWAQAREFWSFRAPQKQATPAVKHKSWLRQPVDYFILARLEQERLTPSPEADRRTWIRRVTFDLTGLPPTPEEITAFLADKKSGAHERLVDRLLASPHFGERLTSLWLNAARYAEDQAHQVGSDTKNSYPNAYRYRAWVIDAFNRDLPYDQFIRLQLAADQPGAAPDDLAALGFLGLGPKYYNRNQTSVMADEWEDRVDTVTQTFLGLTVACARCHDHKFDPVTMQDYYGLAGVFASTRMVNKSATGAKEDTKAEAAKMQSETLHIVEDGDVQNLNIFLRGDVDQKGPVAPRRFLQVLSSGEPAAFQNGSGRPELAAAIASPRNPLTARVLVNRLWGMVFGRPLVATPSNFGQLGERPTHPELLDDLAVRFMQGGWSVKGLIRELVLSATYRQSSHGDAGREAINADNSLLWRMNRRRLEIEPWRDSFLAVAGNLDASGGPSLELDDARNFRRTVYSRISRLKLNDVLIQFDYPDANVHSAKRSVTTTATQKLFVLNSSFMLRQAGVLAARLSADAKQNDRARIERAYQLLYGRAPTSSEVRLGLEFLRQPENPELSRWTQYAQILLAANEMMYLD